ncbi:MAG: mechanosensitive ion channel family protein [Muribaculaceae bacterium]|nr:mechanosensitive ion channel family protein [Muribaculaceae bacterium]
MQRILTLFLFLSGLLGCGNRGGAQLIQRAGEFVRNAFDTHADSVAAGDSLTPAEQLLRDSLRLQEMALRLQEMKLNEIMLRTQLADATGRNHTADSIRRAERKREIDSLRKITPGVPVLVEGDTLFKIYTSMGGVSPADRAERIADAITKIGKERRLRRDTLHILDNEMYLDIMYGDKVIMSLTEQDALWVGKTPRELAELYLPLLDAKIRYLKNENSFWQFLRRAGMFVLVICIQYLIFKLINRLFRRLRRRIIRIKQVKKRGLVIRDYELLNSKSVTRGILFACNLVRVLLLFTVLVLTVPILFSIFPRTEHLAMTLFHYIIDPVKMVLKSVVEYIPNLFIIVVIWYCIRYIVKAFRYLASEIENEKLHISGFYPEWAQPTYNIVRFLLYAFMIAMIYPYLPGSQSGVFQGISVFVGLIVSLGSSTVISNFIAGFVITYMRPFKSGDFIKVKDTVGNVIEKTPFVTRLRTIKNEVVTIPNSFIMSADTVNYSASARRYGLIVHTVMTMGYDVPWRRVHELLIKAALMTRGVEEYPRPFVLETELNDNYMCYQINAYIRDADMMPEIMSDLLQNIQDLFHAAEIDLVAPHFYSDRADSLNFKRRKEEKDGY